MITNHGYNYPDYLLPHFWYLARQLGIEGGVRKAYTVYGDLIPGQFYGAELHEDERKTAALNDAMGALQADFLRFLLSHGVTEVDIALSGDLVPLPEDAPELFGVEEIWQVDDELLEWAIERGKHTLETGRSIPESLTGRGGEQDYFGKE